MTQKCVYQFSPKKNKKKNNTLSIENALSIFFQQENEILI